MKLVTRLRVHDLQNCFAHRRVSLNHLLTRCAGEYGPIRRAQFFSGTFPQSPMKYRPVSSGSGCCGRVAYKRNIASTCCSELNFGCTDFCSRFIISLFEHIPPWFGGYHRCFRTVGKWLDATFLMHFYDNRKQGPNPGPCSAVSDSEQVWLGLCFGADMQLSTPVVPSSENYLIRI